MPTYEEIKKECLEKGSLFEDLEFPATFKSLFFREVDPSITWKRPPAIAEKPVFIREATYYDLNQGKLGNCWFLAGANCLMASNREAFRKVVPIEQSFAEGYAGIFRFNFWYYGEWKEVIVDDRIPVNVDTNEIMYCQNRAEPDEFWICLLEKAYAKLYGCYEKLAGGMVHNALVDMTGGVSEQISLAKNDNDPDQLFDLLYRMWKMNTMVSLAIYSRGKSDSEHKRKTGLLEGHAYAVTRLAIVLFEGRKERLVRIRNPWGTVEWNGAWSDKSKEWNGFSEADRVKLGIVIANNGEFWMRMEDVITHFDAFDLCHQEGAALSEIIDDKEARKSEWTTYSVQDRWVKNVTSGGMDMGRDKYWKNPQFILDIEEKNDRSWTIISLMEIMNRYRKMEDLAVGFDLYKLKFGVSRPLPERFENDALRLLSMSIATPLRENSRGIELSSGTYVIIPFNKQGATADFLMRIYCESAAKISSADDPTDVDEKDKDKEIPRDYLEELFEKHSLDKVADTVQLRIILNEMWKIDKGVSLDMISMETARCLMEYIDKSNTSLVSFWDVKKAWEVVNVWHTVFQLSDTNKSGSIEAYELMRLFRKLGIRPGRKVVEAVTVRYGNRDGHIHLDDFIQSLARIVNLTQSYNKYIRKLRLISLQEWLVLALNPSL